MPHFRRFNLENHCYHVVSVTRDRKPILRNPLHARQVTEALHFLRQDRAFLLAYAVMPDHFHALLVPRGNQTTSRLMQTVKGFTARQINRDAPGLPVWQQSYYDRVVRNYREFEVTIWYIHQNPVEAGLVSRPEEYEFCSAFPGVATDIAEYPAA